MERVHNFFAGPATLPKEVLDKMAESIADFPGIGMSLIETSHRSPAYDEIHNGAVDGIRRVFNVPDNFHILLLQGGATLQFSMIPMNLLHGDYEMDLVNSGAWAKKALADAKKIGKVNVIFDGSEDSFTTLPSNVETTKNGSYLHITSNETIGGVQFQEWPDTDLPLIADMSSDIMSRHIPWEKFGLVYAGAQKNLGPSGVTLVIIRDDLLQASAEDLTAYLSYRIHADKNSLYNTPPVFSIWALKLVMDWLESKGGLDKVAENNEKKSALIYDAMNASDGFYRCPVPKEYRSYMNIVWRLPTEELEKQFIAEAKERGMVGLKGHRSVGGCRASTYNAMTNEGCQALADFMAEFAAANR